MRRTGTSYQLEALLLKIEISIADQENNAQKQNGESLDGLKCV
jgi:hypothetical protein